MKLKMKRSIVVLAAAFAAMSTSAMAENIPPVKAETMLSKSVQLTDVELDGITAGNAVLLVNSGKASVEPKMNKHGVVHGACVNCAFLSEFLPHSGPAFGVVSVENRGHAIPVMHTIGRPHAPF